MTLRITNPATDRQLRILAEDGLLQVRRKYEAARAAQPAWGRMPFSKRAAAIRRFRAALLAEREPLAKTLTSETGKPIAQSRGELAEVLARIDYFIDNTKPRLRNSVVFEDKVQDSKEMISQEPLGVIANISAWNYPYLIGVNVFVPALLTGNAVLYKPSEHAMLSGLEIARLMHASGVPADVFIPVIGGGKSGGALVRQDVDGVFFTGSHATGVKIARDLAGRMLRMQMELGGKDAVYVCEDVDVPAAAAALAKGAFHNSGQSCCSVERIYVHEGIYAAFAAAFVAEVKAFRVGDPADDRTYIGPLARAQQIALLKHQVADAKRKGATLLLGGSPLLSAGGKGNWFAPTVFGDAGQTTELMREESFGPIIGLRKVRDDAEAVALMNDSRYGLTAGVFTRDGRRAERVLSQVRSGSAYWNCCNRVSPRLPWSGIGHSGVGVTLSGYGIDAFLRPRGWHLRAA
jgi:acyl-CoA reductase-like NAD-dependent aldehyde dehydrogenase